MVNGGEKHNVMQLEPRRRRILAAVVERYVESSEPVGSQTLAGDAEFGVRSATIRNEFARLEELNLLTHPHTSAGRIPTDLGYRVYVDELLQPEPITERVRDTTRERLIPAHNSMAELLAAACELLAGMTQYPALVSFPARRYDTIKHVQMGNVDARRILVVIYTQSGNVEHRIFELPASVRPPQVSRVMRILNAKLKGRTIASIRQLTVQDVHEAGEAAEPFVREALAFVQETLAGQPDDRVLVEGIVYLLSQPEFADVEKARTMIGILNDPSRLHPVLEMPLYEGASAVVIGKEHLELSMQTMSFVGFPYRAGSTVLGTVGIVGPTRMKYWQAIPAVEHVAQSLSEHFDQAGL